MTAGGLSSLYPPWFHGVGASLRSRKCLAYTRCSNIPEPLAPQLALASARIFAPLHFSLAINILMVYTNYLSMQPCSAKISCDLAAEAMSWPGKDLGSDGSHFLRKGHSIRG